MSIAEYKHKKIADIAAKHSKPGPVMGQDLKLQCQQQTCKTICYGARAKGLTPACTGA